MPDQWHRFLLKRSKVGNFNPILKLTSYFFVYQEERKNSRICRPKKKKKKGYYKKKLPWKLAMKWEDGIKEVNCTTAAIPISVLLMKIFLSCFIGIKPYYKVQILFMAKIYTKSVASQGFFLNIFLCCSGAKYTIKVKHSLSQPPHRNLS